MGFKAVIEERGKVGEEDGKMGWGREEEMAGKAQAGPFLGLGSGQAEPGLFLDWV